MGQVKKIEVCISNLDLGSGYVWNRVAEHYPDIHLKRWNCMEYCHRCTHVPYVLLNDTEYIEGISAQELWEKVKSAIEQQSDLQSDAPSDLD